MLKLKREHEIQVKIEVKEVMCLRFKISFDYIVIFERRYESATSDINILLLHLFSVLYKLKEMNLEANVHENAFRVKRFLLKLIN